MYYCIIDCIMHCRLLGHAALPAATGHLPWGRNPKRPLSTELFEAVVVAPSALSMASRIKSFQEAHTPASEQADFPKVVRYKRSCGPVCELTAPAQQVALSRSLVGALWRAMTACGGPLRCAKSWVLLCLQCKDAEGQVVGSVWIHVASGIARAGATMAREQFILCEANREISQVEDRFD